MKRIACIGLGVMGGNMARRLLQGGHEVVVLDAEDRLAGIITEADRSSTTVLLPDDY